MGRSMQSIDSALKNVTRNLKAREHQATIPFRDFLGILEKEPERVMRNVFQLFHDMVKSHVSGGEDEYAGDPESIHYFNYDFHSLFVEDADNPFFADRLFGNRLIELVETLRRGAQQNKVYIFEGPHGCGKSTFLNNLLRKFETYANTVEGRRYEAVWRLERSVLASISESDTGNFLDKLGKLLDEYEFSQSEFNEAMKVLPPGEKFV